MDRTLQFIKNHRWILLILVISALLRFYKLDFQSIWMDEIYTMNVANANASFSTMISEINLREGFPYLYFIVLKILFFIFGYEPLVARAFSAIFGIASVYLIYRFGKQILSKRVGLIAAALVATSEYCIYISQDARPYTLYFFASILSLMVLVRFVKNPTVRNAVIFGVASGFLLNTNFFSFINLFSQAVIILFFIALNPSSRERITTIKNSAIAGVIALVMFAPNYKILAKLLEFKSAWIPKPTNESFGIMTHDLLGRSEMTLFLFGPLFLYFLFTLFREKNTSTYLELLANRRVFSFVIIFLWTTVFILVVFVKSYVDTSLLILRYFTSLFPVVFLLFAMAVDAIRNYIVRYSILALLIALMLINNIVVWQYYRVPSKTQFRQAAEFAIKNKSPHEPVYTSLKYWFDYFFVKDEEQLTIERPSLDAVLAEMARDTTLIRPFWYIDAHGRPINIAEDSQKFIDQHFYLESNFDGVDAWGRHFILRKDAPASVDLSKFKKIERENGDRFQMYIENFEETGNTAKVSGWAYFEGISSQESAIRILLMKDRDTHLFQTTKVSRPDVTSYFKSDHDLSFSGYSSTIDLTKLSPGEYQVAIYLKNNLHGKEGLILTDKIIKK